MGLLPMSLRPQFSPVAIALSQLPLSQSVHRKMVIVLKTRMIALAKMTKESSKMLSDIEKKKF